MNDETTKWVRGLAVHGVFVGTTASTFAARMGANTRTFLAGWARFAGELRSTPPPC
jgi:hypothetical protein